MDQEIARLKELTEKSQAMVFFGGAGVSKESGIPDFRSVDGLYHQAYRYPPETILSRSFYEKNPEEFYRFYRDKMLYLDAEPNPAHKKLAQWEREGRLLAVITQNIDGLHQKAGSRNVLELHGSVHRNYCRRCGKLFDAQYLLRSSGVPRCDQCGGAVKPDVVLYEEALDQAVLQKAAGALRQADLLIVGGTSLTVYPAAGLLRYFQGSRLAVVNQTALPPGPGGRPAHSGANRPGPFPSSDSAFILTGRHFSPPGVPATFSLGLPRFSFSQAAFLLRSYENGQARVSL